MFSKGCLCAAFLPLATHAINVISSNDDGWAEKNIRVFYDQLTEAGYSVVVSAPAENKSGSGMYHRHLTRDFANVGFYS